MTVSVQYAAEHLEELLSALVGGESVEIERADQPAVRLSGVVHAPDAPENPQPVKRRILGAGRGLLRVPSEEEWEAMDKEWRSSFRDDKFEFKEA